MKRLLLTLLMFAVAALADLSENLTFGDGSFVSLDSGQISTVAGTGTWDVSFTAGEIDPQGQARVFNVGVRTSGQFDLLTQSDIKTRFLASSARNIPAANLVAGDVFYVLTNQGSDAKVFVVRNSGGTMTVNFVTYQSQSAAPGAPTITAILNNSSLIAAGLPNYGIAPSSLFIVRGTGLADPGVPTLQSSAPPGLPLTLNGASITVTVSGVTTHPAIYYTSPTQVAAVMPANTPVGTGTLTMSYNGIASAPFTIQIVASAPGLNVYGTNTGVAQDAATGAVLTFTNAGSPGGTIVLWATGLGADPADSDTTYASSPHVVDVNLRVYIGGTQAQIIYRGSAGYPGVNIINVVIPQNVATGCWVSLAAVVDNVTSNVATLPISPSGGECFDAVSGLRGSQLAPPGGGTFRAGFVGLALSTDTTGAITYLSTANFSKYTGVTYDPANSLTPGGCIIRVPQPVIIGLTTLDAGVITLSGPNGLNVTLQPFLGGYSANLPTIPQTGGTYTWNGSGGKGVGQFSSTLNLSGPLLTWTNPSAASPITRGSGLDLTWTGGNPGSLVQISGASDLRGGPGVNIPVSFICLEHVEAGKFTVPAYILDSLPLSQTGAIGISNVINFPLSAPGVDFASGVGVIQYNRSVVITTGGGGK